MAVLVALGLGCAARGTSIDAALALLPASTHTLAVVDLATARRAADWPEAAEALRELLAPEGRAPASAPAAAPGAVAAVAALVADLGAAAHVDAAADLDAIVVAGADELRRPLVVVLGRGLTGERIAALLDARGLAAEAAKSHGAKVWTATGARLAVACVSESALLAGDPDDVEDALVRAGAARERTAAGAEELRALRDAVEAPAAAWLVALPSDAGAETFARLGLDAATGGLAVWAGGASARELRVTLRARARDETAAGPLAAALEDALAALRKGGASRAAPPRALVALLREAAVVARGSAVSATLDADLVALLRALHRDGAGPDARAADAALLAAATRALAGEKLGLSPAEVAALVAPFDPGTDLLAVADVAALRAAGAPASAAGLVGSLHLESPLLAPLVDALGYDPARDIEAIAWGVRGVSGPEGLGALVVVRGPPLDLERWAAFLEKSGRAPHRETAGAVALVLWEGRAVGVLPGGLQIWGDESPVRDAAAAAGKGGEALAPLLPAPSAAEPLTGVYLGESDALARLFSAYAYYYGDRLRALVPPLGTGGRASFALGADSGAVTARAWIRPAALADAEAACTALGGAIDELGARAALAGLHARVVAPDCLVEARLARSFWAAAVAGFVAGRGASLADSFLVAMGLRDGPGPTWDAPIPMPPAPAAAAHPHRSVTLTITELRLDGSVVTEAALGEALAAAARADPATDVGVRADAAVPYARVVRVLDIARSSGITKFAIEAGAP